MTEDREQKKEGRRQKIEVNLLLVIRVRIQMTDVREPRTEDVRLTGFEDLGMSLRSVF